MKLYLLCMQGYCGKKEEVEYNEEGWYYFECPNGHKNFVVLQEQKFETLFQIGAHAIYDGYYREAVSSFTAALERFYEFCVRVFCKKHNIPEENIEKCCRFYNKSSERQFGSFLFLYLIEFRDIPFSKQDDDHWRKFRNEVIHNGKIPTQEEAIKYGDYVRKFILNTILTLQHDYNKEVAQIITENLGKKCEKNKYNAKITVSCLGNIISLADGQIEKSLKEDFRSQIIAMKKLEAACKAH